MFTQHALVNLSTQGVFLPTSRPIPLGTLLDLLFVFEDSHQITTRGRVVWENVGSLIADHPGAMLTVWDRGGRRGR